MSALDIFIQILTFTMVFVGVLVLVFFFLGPRE